MAYVIFALLLFCFSMAAHVLFCRMTKASGLHARAFLLIAAFFMAVYITGVYAAGQSGFLDPHSLWGLPLKISAGLVFILLVPVYLSFYVLTQLMSPSKKILLTLAGRDQVPYGEIVLCIEEEDFIGTRLGDLCTSGCARHVNGRYNLTAHGRKISMMLNLMQFVLGRDIGG